jgi:hypothetical protein
MTIQTQVDLQVKCFLPFGLKPAHIKKACRHAGHWLSLTDVQLMLLDRDPSDRYYGYCYQLHGCLPIHIDCIEIYVDRILDDCNDDPDLFVMLFSRSLAHELCHVAQNQRPMLLPLHLSEAEAHIYEIVWGAYIAHIIAYGRVPDRKWQLGLRKDMLKNTNTIYDQWLRSTKLETDCEAKEVEDVTR